MPFLSHRTTVIIITVRKKGEKKICAGHPRLLHFINFAAGWRLRIFFKIYWNLLKLENFAIPSCSTQIINIVIGHSPFIIVARSKRLNDVVICDLWSLIYFPLNFLSDGGAQFFTFKIAKTRKNLCRNFKNCKISPPTPTYTCSSF